MSRSKSENICKIYLITNIDNNKIYIGQTWKPLDIRFKEHCSIAPSRIHRMLITKAINKYGPDKFVIELLATTSSQNVADYLESSYIKEYDSISRPDGIGYNLKDGGSNGKLSQ